MSLYLVENANTNTLTQHNNSLNFKKIRTQHVVDSEINIRYNIFKKIKWKMSHPTSYHQLKQNEFEHQFYPTKIKKQIPKHKFW